MLGGNGDRCPGIDVISIGRIDRDWINITVSLLRWETRGYWNGV